MIPTLPDPVSPSNAPLVIVSAAPDTVMFETLNAFTVAAALVTDAPSRTLLVGAAVARVVANSAEVSGRMPVSVE